MTRTKQPLVPHMNAREVLTRAEMRHLHGLWLDLRGPTQSKGNKGGVSTLELVPHLAASLESLVRQGYGTDDIGMMLGVRYGSVGTWLRKLGLKSTHYHARYRVWSDRLRRFVSVPSKRCPTRSRSIKARKGGLIVQARFTPAQRRANARRAIANLTHEQLSAMGRKGGFAAKAARLRRLA
jgi:hypothetical protein